MKLRERGIYRLSSRMTDGDDYLVSCAGDAGGCTLYDLAEWHGGSPADREVSTDGAITFQGDPDAYGRTIEDLVDTGLDAEPAVLRDGGIYEWAGDDHVAVETQDVQGGLIWMLPTVEALREHPDEPAYDYTAVDGGLIMRGARLTGDTVARLEDTGRDFEQD